MSARNNKNINVVLNKKEVKLVPFAFRFLEKVSSSKRRLLATLGEEGTSDIVWTGDEADSIERD